VLSKQATFFVATLIIFFFSFTVVQKMETDGGGDGEWSELIAHQINDDLSLDVISVDGSIRVLTDEYTSELLNPRSPTYKEKAEKYVQKIANTYAKSHLAEAFVDATVDGFSSGSLRVFFKVKFQKSKLPRWAESIGDRMIINALLPGEPE